MNYDNYDCRLRLSPEKAAKPVSRKTTRKPRPSGHRENRIFAAIRSVTAIAVSFLACTMVAQAQFKIQPLTEADSKDARIYENVPNSQNNLNITSLDIGAHFVAMVQFDLSLSPYNVSQVTAAYLQLYVTALGASGGPAAGGTVTLSPITDPWRESAASPGTDTVATYAAFFGIPANGSNPAVPPTLHFGAPASSLEVTGTGLQTWDVTNLVKSWMNGSQNNYGVIIQLSSNGGDIGIADVDTPGTLGTQPSLTIVPEPGSALLALSGTGFLLARRRKLRHAAA